MASPVAHWNGRLFGTNVGNLAVELSNTESGISGVARFLDERWGIVVYQLTGSFTDGSLNAEGTPAQVPDGQSAGKVKLAGALASDGSLFGSWVSELGTGGSFRLWHHQTPEMVSGPSAAPASAATATAEQLRTITRPIGSVRLYGDDVRSLIRSIEKSFKQPKVIVTYFQHDNEISRYAQDFETELTSLGRLTTLKLTVREPEAFGIDRIATIELYPWGENFVRTQGVDETWVTGRAEALHKHLRQHERMLPTAFRRFGLNINTGIGFFALVAVPGLPTFEKRAAFMAVILVIILTIGWLHKRFVPNAIIDLIPEKPSLLAQLWPQFTSWMIATISGAAAAASYGLIKDGAIIGNMLRWFAGP